MLTRACTGVGAGLTRATKSAVPRVSSARIPGGFARRIPRISLNDRSTPAAGRSITSRVTRSGIADRSSPAGPVRSSVARHAPELGEPKRPHPAVAKEHAGGYDDAVIHMNAT